MTDTPAARARTWRAGRSRPARNARAGAPWSSPPAITHWRASAEGNGAIDALYRAVDKALAGVLDGHPRLLAYDIHALGEGTDTIGAVTVRIAPPRCRRRARPGRVHRRGARAEHHRRVDRGVHRGAQRDARRGALVRARPRRPATGSGVEVSAGTAREQRAEIDEGEGPARHDGLVRAVGPRQGSGASVSVSSGGMPRR